MSGHAPLKVLLTWKPYRGLERVEGCLSDIEVHATDDRDQILKLISGADVACVGRWDAEIFRAARKLRWVHSFSGGVTHALFPEFVASPVPLTCLKGTFNNTAAEYALGVMLAFTRKIEYDIRQRPRRSFEEQEMTELHGKTVGIIGMGSMGAEIAKRCQCFGMTVIGVSRQSLNNLPTLLAESDFVVVCVPLTDQTRGMIGATELSTMKKSAYLIDVSGRPAIYDLDALQKALLSGKITGASLQMVPPPESPLWELDNLILSYHRVVSREHFDLGIEMFCENLRRFAEDRPLLGLVDKQAGY